MWKLIPWRLVGACAIVAALVWYHLDAVSDARTEGYEKRSAEVQAARDAELSKARERVIQLEREQRAYKERLTDETAKELASVRARHAALPATVIRVCVDAPSVRADAAGGSADPAGGTHGAAEAGLRREDGAGTVAYFSTGPFREIAIEAEEDAVRFERLQQFVREQCVRR